MGAPMDVSVAIITWNAEGYLRRCLETVHTQTRDVLFDVVVVDNASQDGSAEFVRTRYPSVVLVVNTANRGVAPARNQALERTTGRYLLILDVDTEVASGAIGRMVRYMDAHPDIGLLGPRLVDGDGNLHYSCRRFHMLLTPLFRRLTVVPGIKNSRVLRDFLMVEWDHQTPREVDHVIGACQMIRREAFERVGWLDGRMFYGWEDTDYCVRMHRAGYRVVYYPGATVIHHEQRTTARRWASRSAVEHAKAMVMFFMKYPTGVWGRYC